MGALRKWIIGLILALPLIVAAAFSISNLLFLKNTATSTGTIVSFNKSGTTKISYYPVIKFEAGNYGEVTFNSPTGFSYELGTDTNSERPYYLQQKVKIAYKTDNPHDAQIADFRSLWMMPLITGAAGLILWSPLLLGLIGKWFYYRQKHKEDPLNFP